MMGIPTPILTKYVKLLAPISAILIIMSIGTSSSLNYCMHPNGDVMQHFGFFDTCDSKNCDILDGLKDIDSRKHSGCGFLISGSLVCALLQYFIGDISEGVACGLK
ncbi:hypothetical protein RF11_02237 [Thelohanellus kitauei]|uniref:Uncharacterized protein n=1 Tax=Thelohanellus kitauei TaxID=669202 RepID=A0A0C2IDN0_THEKT|nr:hypothetical protein RF11_02237 [Thelohanellus kitauei]